MATRRNGGWSRSEEFVRAELKRHGQTNEKILAILTRVQVDVGQLKIKAGVWGLIAGMIPSSIGFLIWVVTKD